MAGTSNVSKPHNLVKLIELVSPMKACSGYNEVCTTILISVSRHNHRRDDIHNSGLWSWDYRILQLHLSDQSRADIPHGRAWFIHRPPRADLEHIHHWQSSSHGKTKYCNRKALPIRFWIMFEEYIACPHWSHISPCLWRTHHQLLCGSPWFQCLEQTKTHWFLSWIMFNITSNPNVGWNCPSRQKHEEASNHRSKQHLQASQYSEAYWVGKSNVGKCRVSFDMRNYLDFSWLPS